MSKNTLVKGLALAAIGVALLVGWFTGSVAFAAGAGTGAYVVARVLLVRWGI